MELSHPWPARQDTALSQQMLLAMLSMFKSSKSPTEAIKVLRENFGHEEVTKHEEASKQLANISLMLFGGHKGQASEQVQGQLCQELSTSGLLLKIVTNFHRSGHEGRKDTANIFTNVLQRQIGTRSPIVEYICQTPEILFALCRGYEVEENALNCGAMLRDCIRYQPLAKIILYSNYFMNFFRLIEAPCFHSSSDAFQTFRELLTRHKLLAAEFLEENYDIIFQRYQSLLDSDNNVTRRQSLKLLAELLLEPHNFHPMTMYISNQDNLKLIMIKMKSEQSLNIQFQAFQVFKVFVAYPNKPKSIVANLLRNRDQLVEFLTDLQADSANDDQFEDEKAYLIKVIKELKKVKK